MASEKKRKRRESEAGQATPEKLDKAERKRLKRERKEKEAAEAEAAVSDAPQKDTGVSDVPAFVSPIATRKYIL